MTTKTTVPATTGRSAGHGPVQRLPLTHRLQPAYGATLLIALLTAGAASYGLLNRATVYPTPELQTFALANDLVTLIVGLPALLAGMALAGRGRLAGLLLWPAALFYGLYNYFAYLLGLPFGPVYVLYLLIVTLSTYTLAGLVAAVDGPAVQRRLAGQVPAKSGGAVLITFAVLFLLRTLAEMANAGASAAAISDVDLALLVTDFLFIAAWAIGGWLWWQQRPLGFVAGPIALLHGGLLFAGVLAIVLVQPLFTPAPFNAGDFLFLLVMSLVCFIPCALTLRGIRRSEAPVVD